MRGGLCTKYEDIKQDFEDYYLSLLGTFKPVFPVNKKVVKVGKYLTEHHCEALLAHEVIEAVKNVFQTGQLLKQCNNTVITLVPKIEVPETVLQFSPIACCNTVYKCISKDLIRLYKRKSCSLRRLMKPDLHKAYESIEWSFREEMLEVMGFPKQMLTLLMQCISTPSYSIALNGELVTEIGRATGIKLGNVPFKYLVVNVSPKRLSTLYCNCLVDNVVDRIKGMGARHLSYASRIFILPKVIIKKIEAICRDYLWHGKFDSAGLALVAWEKLCRSKKQGGLGLKNLIFIKVRTFKPSS
ncbi:uncharacterized protein LOC141614459 [Silene latifolia]|uniref:uncharacterized protein LOC141614459 n=1 Tax=Silene latifolia TaxID=37657 RepID=UPI003D78A2FB